MAESLTAAPTSLPSTSPPLPRPEVLPRRESDSSVALERWQPSCDSPTDAIVGMCVWRGVASPHESFAESPRVEHDVGSGMCGSDSSSSDERAPPPPPADPLRVEKSASNDGRRIVALNPERARPLPNQRLGSAISPTGRSSVRRVADVEAETESALVVVPWIDAEKIDD